MFSRKKKYHYHEIDPDEIFLDSHNLPEFNRSQFEGRLEKPIAKHVLTIAGALFVGVLVLFSGKLAVLQIDEGEMYRARAENNHLHRTIIFTERGIIKDKNGVELAWNTPFDATLGKPFAERNYILEDGFAHLLGYIHYPQKDRAGFYYEETIQGGEGIERSYDEILSGENGVKLVETDVSGDIRAQNILEPPEDGDNLTLTIDARVQAKLYSSIKSLAESVGFSGGAGVLMDVETGEVLALTSFPEYDSNIISSGKDPVALKKYQADARAPFLNRTVSGLYTPGSIIKPFIALGALVEGVVDENTKILSTGSISIPNPYFPDKPSIFRDWKAHGWTNMREALAVSSDVYFYEIGGGYQNQRGLGIEKINEYTRLFGFGGLSGIDLLEEVSGVIPTPEWKQEIFNDVWRLGDTYNTAIGQYGFQITPIQAVRAVSSVANDGILVAPHVVMAIEENNRDALEKGKNLVIVSGSGEKRVPIATDFFQIVREGMREAVLHGTGQGLFLSSVSVAAKTGTAEVGISKKRVNSWIIGFFPYENPRFAFAIVMEHGPRENLVGALYVARELLEWMSIKTPEYLKEDI